VVFVGEEKTWMLLIRMVALPGTLVKSRSKELLMVGSK
jgi:hypothetical protein